MLLIVAMLACSTAPEWSPCGPEEGEGLLVVPESVSVDATSADTSAAVLLDVQGAAQVCSIECDSESLALSIGLPTDSPDGWVIEQDGPVDVPTDALIYAVSRGANAGDTAECWIIASDGDHAVTVTAI